MAARPLILSRRSFIAASTCAVAGLLVGCGSASGTGGDIPEVPQYQSPYDWSGLMWDGERLDYFENDVVCSRWGIDVSEHQGSIDWEKVATTSVQYAFVRIGNRGATAGALGVDDYFRANATGAAEVGIPVGAYFFSQSINEDEAREEANFALDAVRAVEADGVSFTHIAYDHEEVEIDGARANDLSTAQFSANAEAFCETIAAAGYEPMIYGNQIDLLRLAPGLRERYPLWLAEYGVDAPTAPLDFAIWQYTNAGTVPGIETDVDLNLWLTAKGVS